jgi:hypothetical protein
MGVALALLGCAQHRGGQTGDEDSRREIEDFLDELERAQGEANYQPASSIDALAARSDVIVVGQLERFERGRDFTRADADGKTSIELSTAVLHLEVLDVLKGEPGHELYLELYAGANVSVLPLTVSGGRVLVFATLAPSGPISSGGGVQNEGLGLPDGATLHRITTPQGFTLEINGVAVPIFERTDTLLAASDFDELVQRVLDLLHPPVLHGDDGAVLEQDAAAMDSSVLEDASATDDAGGALLSFTEPLFFSVPINSVRHGVSAYDPTTGLCISAIWPIAVVDETRFCEEGMAMGAPNVVIEPGVEAGCWDYGGNVEVLEQRGCVDFGDLTIEADDAVDIELDLSSDLFTGTVRFQR